ncbi:hypothetical protein A1O1_01185 [Capronia coronata CBS 617.96]|uniref:RING-type domain-containing protein n=1 Tax=Capronia coronata CBS 617.96 TaxID=1182541 RepID=W9ZNK4_9EURO|nr:uncharacterized protein A1O1_01185 [Capronia coronata CBS 617.96]EXJ96059.1 hypothetical protein A1O1_01185 [Capronia coronata CBS 617.96]
MATTDISLLSTFQKHIEDMRNLSLCKICIKPFYEPFILPCGHTYCYSCLASWFGGSHSRKRKKNCPDCRAEVKVQPSPNYLLRDLVHMFISRAELLPEDETVQEHQQAKEDEAVMLAADRTGVGLFKGAFVQPRHHHHIVSWGQGIMDYEDGVVRCPECHWELEDGQCLQCGFLQYEPGDSESDSEEESIGSQSLHTVDTDFDVDGDDFDHEFGSSMDPRYYEPYEDYESPTDASQSDLGEYYGEGFVNGFLDDDDDDASSESTMTMYDRQRRTGPPTGPFGQLDQIRSENSEPGPEPGHGRTAHSPTNGEISDAPTNYDEESEASEQANTYIPARTRPRRIVVSDDSEEGSEASNGGESASEEATGFSDVGQDEQDIESEDSDIRPPQPSALRRQRLQGQRARRTNHSQQTHTRAPGIQSNHAQENERQQSRGSWRPGGPIVRISAPRVIFPRRRNR